MIPKILHFVWLGSAFPSHCYARIATFIQHNPNYVFRLWRDHNIEKDLDLDLCALRARFPKQAGVSNAVRLKALARCGGLYFDTDFLCHAPLDPLLRHHAVASFQDVGRICNAFMGAEPGHPWIQWQLDHMDDWEGHGPEWGVYNATNAPRDGLTIVPPETVYPYHFDLAKEERGIKTGTLAEHLWEGSWVETPKQ